MERFSQRESVLLGYSPRSSFINEAASPNSPYRNSDIDFNDVFGGPPRRSSVHEMRYSFSEATDNSASRGHDETVGSRNSWNALSEKPVFGEEGMNRRQHRSENFFDDIFKGNQSLSSSPRKRDWDPYSSSPGSRVLSPARPLPPKAEPYGSSLPAQFSLPAKLTKGMELPTFGSTHRSPYKSKEGASNGMNLYPSPLSRSSSLNQDQEERNDARSSHRQSLLSRELSLNSEQSSNLTKYDETDTEIDLKKESNSSEAVTNESPFHFSIYKWASKGVPLALAMAPRGGNSSRLKEDSGTDRSSGSDGWIGSERMARELPKKILPDTKSFAMEHNEQDNGSPSVTSAQDTVEPCQRVGPDDSISQSTGEETQAYSQSKIGLSDILEKKKSVVAEEGRKPDLKPLCSLFYDNDFEQSNEDIPEKASRKESTVKITKKSSVVFDSSKIMKKRDGKKPTLDNAEVGKASLQASTINSGDPGKIRVKGKVKEFVKIFNQESLAKPETSVASPSQSSSWKAIGIAKARKEVNFSKTGTDEKIHRLNGHTKKSMPGAPIMVDEYLQQSEKQHSSVKNTNHMSNGSSRIKDSSSTASIPNDPKVVVGDLDESFQENFQVKELTEDENKLPQAGNDHEDIQAIDAKIRQWSNGKEGNIRSLLSTLQYVLWPDCGWKPVPLVDIIEGNAVKRSYQKALLCLHPDKLQQKGAASHQKYTAENVFDILQDAWTHFNSLGSM
ncbi:hypothetical protein Pint_08918 [Pistacia integerrima]|uniref:Uncharacterized protein n=1 Tax=Pistacia integerrima TaxID=434235 RepID=A0ACC0XTV4_9ROSI|nr:hypothetical protein Pint_08918 [Pistacia integerrima]